MKNILLDYDGTYTALPDAWNIFCDLAHSTGYRVYIVTMRDPSEPIDPVQLHDGTILPVIYTSKRAKIPYCLEQNLEFAIYIEDKPAACFMDFETLTKLDDSNSGRT